MMKREVAFLFLVLGFLPRDTFFAQTAPAPARIEHNAVLSFSHGDKLQIQARAQAELEWLRFYYRAEGVQEFQVRNMEKREDSNYVYEFNTAELPGLKFEYYLEAKTSGGVGYAPPGAPQKTYASVGQSRDPLPEVPPGAPSPQEEAKRFRLPVNLTGSIQALLKEHHHPGESQQGAQTAANVRIFTSYTKDDLNLGVDSNLAYAKTPIPGANKLDLSNMMVSASKGGHSLKAGDINITETEFTVAGLGRRGFDYAFRSSKLSVRAFDVSAQQLRGFKGIGFPKGNANILGGALGYKFFKDMILLKAVYLAGKDDPSQGINVGFSPFVKSRKGNVLALVEETYLFQNRLTLAGEFARSDFDEDVQDQRGSRSDFAWKIGGNLSSRLVTAGATYRRIGKDFNSIGFPFFTNDRQSLEANLGWHGRSWPNSPPRTGVSLWPRWGRFSTASRPWWRCTTRSPTRSPWTSSCPGSWPS